jgi:carbamoyl-phosphate synthase small subunit
LTDYLTKHGITAVSEIDTRRLARHIRDRGAMPVAMGSDVDEAELLDMAATAPGMSGLDLASGVSTPDPYEVAAVGERLGRVVAIDLGIKRDIAASLASRGYDVTIVPSTTDAGEILALEPDGLFLSNGPGDPEPLTGVVNTVKRLIGTVPLFGICLGHQVLGLAAGAATFKMGFGHHGANHPVQRLADGKVAITSQNHGFAVDLWPMAGREAPPRNGMVVPGLLPAQVDTEFGPLIPTHQNLNDGTLEGMALPDASVFSVQYHPEAAPGPRDAAPLFDQFSTMIGRAG